MGIYIAIACWRSGWQGRKEKREMIKGRYVAQIEVDFTYDEGNADFQTLHERLDGEWIDRAVTAVVADVFKGGEPIVKVTKQRADIYVSL